MVNSFVHLPMDWSARDTEDKKHASTSHLLGSEMSASMSALHFMMLMGYFAATSLRVRIVPNFSAGFDEDRNNCSTATIATIATSQTSWAASSREQ